MKRLIALSVPTADQASALRAQLLALQSEELVQVIDAVVVERTDNGKVRLDQLVDLTARGTLSGAFWGTLIGLIFASPVFGLAAGMAVGAAGGALSDIGIEDGFMKRLGESLEPGTAALFVMVNHLAEDKVLSRLEGLDQATLLTTNLDVDDEAELRRKIEAHRG